ncbi:MAG: hypothetical protein DMD89_05910 [Candidatus Rokuibacteriota bacterium]|nr:MAG: hypothetical protein DMD89_05910 [Candidatus Rokubacteria bacterium]
MKYSFCGKSQNDVCKMIAGPTMYLSASRLRGRFSKVLASCSNPHIPPDPTTGQVSTCVVTASALPSPTTKPTG